VSGPRSGALPAIALAVFAFLFVLNGYQATSEAAANRFLGRLFAALVELDRWLPAHREDLQALATRAGPQNAVSVPDLPAALSVPAGALLGDDSAARRAIQDAAGAVLYEQGTGAFHSGDISPAEPARWTIEFLERGTHRAWSVALLVAAAFAGGLALLALLRGRSAAFQPVLLSALAGGAAYLLLSVAFYGGASLAHDAAGGPIGREVAHIVRDGAWIGGRAGLAVAGAAGLLAGAWALLGRLSSPAEEWVDALDDTGPD
jgi:hypothetical protein